MPPSTDATPTRAWIGLGANLGDAEATLERAMASLDALPRTRLVARSSLWRTAPHEAGGDDFTNAVAALETGLAPIELLDALQAIEAANGRERPYRNAPRTLDLDLLLYGDLRLDVPRLRVPHPRLHERAFVLAPLAEVDAALVVPGFGVVSDLLEAVGREPVAKLIR